MTEMTTGDTSQFPVIQLWEDILVVPIIGSMNNDRTQELMKELLVRTRESGARVVILDLSGVEVMDTQVSKHILDLKEAVRLMGAEYRVCGIQPEQTHSLVDLGIDLDGIETHHDLSSAFQGALDRLGYRITKQKGETDQ